MINFNLSLRRILPFVCISIFLITTNALAQLPTDSLLLHYSFNGDVLDQSPNAFDGTINGATLTTDRFGNANSAFSFNGTNTHIDLPFDSILQPDFPFTVSLWFKPDSLTSTSASTYLFASDQQDSVYSGFWVIYNAAGKVGAGYGDGMDRSGSNRITKVSNTVLDTTTWHSVVTVFNGLNDIDIYIDCELEPGYYSGSGNSMFNHGNSGALGKSSGGWYNGHFNGKLDDIRFYNDTLSLSDIDLLCNESSCDEIDNTITISGDTMISNTPGAQYRWFTCNEGFVALPDDTLMSFIPSTNGSYTVEITLNGCVDTSDCVQMTRIGIEENLLYSEIKVFPNPSQGDVNLKLPQATNAEITVQDILGRTIHSAELINASSYQFELADKPGIYILTLTIKGEKRSFKIVKH